MVVSILLVTYKQKYYQFPKSYQEHLLTSVAMHHVVSGSTPVYPLSGDVLGSSQQSVQIRPRLTGYLPCLRSHKRRSSASAAPAVAD